MGRQGKASRPYPLRGVFTAVAGIPQNFYVQQANGQVYLLWDLVTGATSYSVYRSTDGITYSSLASPTVPEKLDSTVSNGTKYWYKVASVNGSGTSSFCSPQSIIPSPTSEMSLAALRLASQQKADRVNSNFVTLPEWNTFINLALTELYDLLITTFEDYFTTTPALFTADGTTFLYSLPDGIASYTNLSGSSFVAAPFYKLTGVDLGVNVGQNSFISLTKFNFANRNQFVYPTPGGAIYGVFNPQYRLVGNKIEFIPTPQSGAKIRLWYIPRLPFLLQEADITTIGFSGWLQYVIVRAAKYALDKEESDTGKLDAELLFLKERIENSAMNRDVGSPDTISDVRSDYGMNGGRGGYGGPTGVGW